MVGADPRRTKSEAIGDDGTPRDSSREPSPRATNPDDGDACDPPSLFPSTRSLTPSARAASASRRSQTRRRAGSAWTITRTSSSDRASARAGCVFLPRDPRRSPPPSCHRVASEASSRFLAPARVDDARRVAPTNRARSSFRPGSFVLRFSFLIAFLTRLSRLAPFAAGARAMHGALAASVQRQVRGGSLQILRRRASQLARGALPRRHARRLPHLPPLGRPLRPPKP